VVHSCDGVIIDVHWSCSWLTSQGTVYSTLANGQSAAGSQGFVCSPQGGIVGTTDLICLLDLCWS
jgi:hypothetical protein